MKTLPNITTEFSDWYNAVIEQAELADHSPVRGSIVIRPYGYAIWELIQSHLDKRIKATGHQNASFPLLIPESFLKKEAQHVEGFAPEVAVVTHAGGKKLEEALVVRPTSETIVHAMFARWLHSWRDLPIKINQWANVVRWEMRPRAFLRTTEFFWQEGHTAHATRKEARDEVLLMLGEYMDLAQNWLAIPAVAGLKPEMEKFPGADETHTFEGLMQDGKAVQMGTSHLLSQSFAHSFDMKFQDENGQLAYPYLTSWGVTTRLVGALIMVHGDAKGLVLPPKLAPIQVIIIPILKTGTDTQQVLACAQELKQKLVSSGIRAEVDSNETKMPGAKFYHWELKGVPVRLEIGPRDIAAQAAVMTDRLGLSTKEAIPFSSLETVLQKKLEDLQEELYQRALKRRNENWFKRKKYADFSQQLAQSGGFYQTGWCGQGSCEQKLKESQATIRCVLPDQEFSHCFNCDKGSSKDILVAKSY
jgi:prolyl-tRNA synthetase